MDPAALSASIDAFRQTQVANYACVSALALLIYDMVLTQTLEIKHIWGSRWSMPKAMYIFCRYYAFVHLVINVVADTSTNNTIGICEYHIRITAFGPQALAIVTDALLIMRLRAMYQNSKKVTSALVVLFIGQAIAEATVAAIYSGSPAIPTPSFLHSLPGCLYGGHENPHALLGVWMPTLSFATLILAMTLYKFWEFRTTSAQVNGLFVLFARDGALFFAMIFCLQLFTTLTTALAPHGRFEDLGVPWLVAVYGIVTPRLLFNLREYTAKEQSLGSTGLSFEMHVPLSMSTAIERAEIV